MYIRISISVTVTSVERGGSRFNSKKMQHVEQFATLKLVEYKKETTAAVKRKAPPNVPARRLNPLKLIL